MIKAVLFDMDGLLIDSEKVAVDVCIKIGQKFGWNITYDLMMHMLGRTREGSTGLYRAAIPDFDPDKYYPALDTAMREIITKDGIPLKKGALELLTFLKAHHIPAAVASSSPEDRIRLCLLKTGTTALFDAVVSGENLKNSKPAPDIFLLAAQRVNTPAAECLVLEDSENGIKAGRAAGCTVGMVPDLIAFRADFAPYCDAVLQDLSQAITLIENGEGGR